MSTQHMDDTSAASAWLSHIGEIVIAVAVAGVGWIVKTFAGRHLESVDSISRQLQDLTREVAQVRIQLEGLAIRQELSDERIKRLEDREC